MLGRTIRIQGPTVGDATAVAVVESAVVVAVARAQYEHRVERCGWGQRTRRL